MTVTVVISFLLVSLWPTRNAAGLQTVESLGRGQQTLLKLQESTAVFNGTIPTHQMRTRHLCCLGGDVELTVVVKTAAVKVKVEPTASVLLLTTEIVSKVGEWGMVSVMQGKH